MKKIIVYKYGLRRPTVNAELVEDQMRLANRYRNRLIEIERERRDAVREVYGKRDLEIEDIVQRHKEAGQLLKSAIGDLKKTRAKTRSRSETAEQKDRIKRLREEKRAVGDVLREAREKLKLDDHLQKRLIEIQDNANRGSRAARDICGVFWGTYLLVEQAMDASRKMKLWHKGEPNDPKFRRWRGDGTVGIQIQEKRRIPVETNLACESNWLQLDMEPLPSGASKTRAKRQFGTFRMRVGSDGRNPIWAEWPILMHRPLPEGAKITWAQVKRAMVSNQEKWSLHLTLSLPDDYQHRDHGKGRGAVAVDIGWRLMDGGVRVAYLLDTEGEERDFRVDSGVLSGLRKVEDLQSIRGKKVNEMRDNLWGWLKEHREQLPEWLRTATSHLYQWEKSERFAGLLRKWSTERWDGDKEGFATLETWNYGIFNSALNRREGGDLHLWQWQEHQRKKSLRRRKDQYCRLGAELAARYKVLIIEDFDLRKMQKHNRPEDKAENKAARLQQKDVSCSEMRLWLINDFLSRGGQVVKVDPAMTTQRCYECGYEGQWDAAPEVEHECEQCGAVWDQDANAARNILQLYREDQIVERLGGDDMSDKKSLSKWAKRGRHKGTARKHDNNELELQE